MRGKVSDGSKLIDSIFKDIETTSSAANKLMEINPLPDRNLGISSKEHHINVASEMVGKELGKMSAYELLTEKANQLIFELGETRAKEILEPVNTSLKLPVPKAATAEFLMPNLVVWPSPWAEMDPLKTIPL